MAEIRTALVTGGASGIGRAICLALASTNGARVAVCDIRETNAEETVALVDAAGGHAAAFAMDITDNAAVREGVAEIASKLGHVEVLVNCAGWSVHHPFAETDEAFWDRIIEVNYKGVLRTTSAVLPSMLEGGWGRIVNIGSDAARVGSSNEAVYAGAKAGVIAFTKTIAREAARRGITANTVCPGPTDTPLLDAVIAASDDSAKVISAMTRAVAMKRLGRPEEVAAAVAFFASEQAGFVTGQTLSVSGGLTMV